MKAMRPNKTIWTIGGKRYFVRWRAVGKDGKHGD